MTFDVNSRPDWTIILSVANTLRSAEERPMVDPAVLEHIRMEGSRLIKVIEQHRRQLPSRYCLVVPDLIRIVTSQSYIDDIEMEEETKVQENPQSQRLRLIK
jgi:hypothetical protein